MAPSWATPPWPPEACWTTTIGTRWWSSATAATSTSPWTDTHSTSGPTESLTTLIWTTRWGAQRLHHYIELSKCQLAIQFILYPYAASSSFKWVQLQYTVTFANPAVQYLSHNKLSLVARSYTATQWRSTFISVICVLPSTPHIPDPIAPPLPKLCKFIFNAHMALFQVSPRR